jgi:phosphate/sulfate permease
LYGAERSTPNVDVDQASGERRHVNLTLVAVVAVALFFDFTNGFHDAANAVATTVSTRALTPRIAVGFAALLNFAGAFI